MLVRRALGACQALRLVQVRAALVAACEEEGVPPSSVAHGHRHHPAHVGPARHAYRLQLGSAADREHMRTPVHASAHRPARITRAAISPPSRSVLAAISPSEIASSSSEIAISSSEIASCSSALLWWRHREAHHARLGLGGALRGRLVQHAQPEDEGLAAPEAIEPPGAHPALAVRAQQQPAPQRERVHLD